MLFRRNNFSSKDTSEVDSQFLYLFSCLVKPSGDLFQTSSLAGDDVDDDGGADEGRNGIEGNDTTLAWEEADEVADEGHDGTTEDGGGQQYTMVVCREQQSGDMGHGEANEGHRTTEGGGNGGENTCHYQQPVARTEDIDAQVFCILVAQHEGI